MFLIDFFFFRPGQRQLQSKYVLKVAPIRWLSRKGDGGRRGDLFVFLIQVPPARRAQAANRRRHDYNFAYNVAGMQRIGSGRRAAQQSAFMWLLAAGRQSTRVKVEARRLFFLFGYDYLFLSFPRLSKQWVVVALE